MTTEILLPSRKERSALWSELVEQAEAYFEEVESLPVAPTLNQAELQAVLDTFSFDDPRPRIDVLRELHERVKEASGPRSSSSLLFRPVQSSSHLYGNSGDCVTATLNPQLAAWSHSPLAVETERR